MYPSKFAHKKEEELKLQETVGGLMRILEEYYESGTTVVITADRIQLFKNEIDIPCKWE